MECADEMSVRISTEPPLVIACDESGNDGENNLGGNSSVFVHASVSIPVDVAQGLMDEVRMKTCSRAAELKSRTLLQARNRSVAEWLLQHPELADRASLVFVHKEFFTVAKLFDSTAEEVAHSLGVDLYANGGALSAATILYFTAPGAFGPPWHSLLRAFEAFLRAPDAGTARHRLGRLTGEFRELLAGSDSPIRQLLEPVFIGIEHLEELSELQLGNGIAERLRTADPLLAGVGATVSEWGTRSGRPIAVVHDEAKELTAARIQWLKDYLRHPEMVVESNAGLGVEVTDFILVDSKTDPRVQVADLLAGLGRVVAERSAVGEEHSLLSSVGSFQSGLSIWPVYDHVDPQKARATSEESRKVS